MVRVGQVVRVKLVIVVIVVVFVVVVVVVKVIVGVVVVGGKFKKGPVPDEEGAVESAVGGYPCQGEVHPFLRHRVLERRRRG